MGTTKNTPNVSYLNRSGIIGLRTTIPFEGNVLAVSYRLSAVRKKKYSDVIHIMLLHIRLSSLTELEWKIGGVEV